jgi:hypothetical protein
VGCFSSGGALHCSALVLFIDTLCNPDRFVVFSFAYSSDWLAGTDPYFKISDSQRYDKE